VSGSVNVSGTITTGNGCCLRYWKVTGTTNGTPGIQSDYPTPTGMSTTPGNIVAIWGVINCGGSLVPCGANYVAGWVSILWMNGTNISITPIGNSTLSCQFIVTIVTLV